MARSLIETDSFINVSGGGGSASSSPGYWEPHSSSIDFCETNYLLSRHVVEPHNVWSSVLGLSLVGVLGMIHGNPTKERRYSLYYLALVVIGVGSSCLHASLNWRFQSADELPMIYLVIVGLYCFLENESPAGKPRYPYLPAYLALMSVANTVVYYRFQHLYIIFLGTFLGLTIMAMYLHVQIAWRVYRENSEGKATGGCFNNNAIALQFYKWHYIVYVAVAVPIWVLDQLGCVHLLPTYNNLPFPFTGMTFHVVWHVCAGLGAHAIAQFSSVRRASSLGMECETRFALGVLPVAVIKQKTP